MSLIRTATFSLRILTLAGLFLAPVGALALNKAGIPGIQKQGAGLVLFVTLQRQSLS